MSFIYGSNSCPDTFECPLNEYRSFRLKLLQTMYDLQTSNYELRSLSVCDIVNELQKRFTCMVDGDITSQVRTSLQQLTDMGMVVRDRSTNDYKLIGPVADVLKPAGNCRCIETNKALRKFWNDLDRSFKKCTHCQYSNYNVDQNYENINSGHTIKTCNSNPSIRNINSRSKSKKHPYIRHELQTISSKQFKLKPKKSNYSRSSRYKSNNLHENEEDENEVNHENTYISDTNDDKMINDDEADNFLSPYKSKKSLRHKKKRKNSVQFKQCECESDNDRLDYQFKKRQLGRPSKNVSNLQYKKTKSQSSLNQDKIKFTDNNHTRNRFYNKRTPKLRVKNRKRPITKSTSRSKSVSDTLNNLSLKEIRIIQHERRPNKHKIAHRKHAHPKRSSNSIIRNQNDTPTRSRSLIRVDSKLIKCNCTCHKKSSNNKNDNKIREEKEELAKEENYKNRTMRMSKKRPKNSDEYDENHSNFKSNFKSMNKEKNKRSKF